MPVKRTRLAVGLISLATIGLELWLMRWLSLRYWHHFAYMVISVALLGFGASGTVITLLRRWVRRHIRGWLCVTCLAFAVSVPVAAWAARQVSLNVPYLAWDLWQDGRVLLLEAVLLVPFLMAGAAVCIALLDEPARLGGHYAASLIGSGVGAIGAVALMFVIGTGRLPLLFVAAGLIAGGVLIRWRGLVRPICGVAVFGAVLVGAWLADPFEPVLSQYKRLSYEHQAGGRTILHGEGPLGRIDVVEGPAVHHHPGLSLQFAGEIPPHVLMIVDGDQTSAVYDCRRREDWTFLDWTAPAVAYALRDRPRVLVIGAGGGGDIGLATLHDSPSVLALEINPQLIAAMTGPLAARGGGIYRAPGVRVLAEEARGLLARTSERFDVIQLPAIDAFGASGAGLHATQESYLYTVESFSLMLSRLSENGLLCITRWARTPPRDGLRALDTLAEALRGMELDPTGRIAMIRTYATVTLLASRTPLSTADIGRIRTFCNSRGFDLCVLPGMTAAEANQHHRLDEPVYFHAAAALLSPKREDFITEYRRKYGFHIDAATDDRPYYFRFGSPRQTGGETDNRLRAFQETGYLMLVAALVQACVFAVVLVVIPLTPGITRLRTSRRKAACLGYFLLLGAGFMLLEMGFLQRLILYLAHPIYAAAVVISGFLLFAGFGSMLSLRWPLPAGRLARIAGGAVAAVALLYMIGMDRWLTATQSLPLGVRFLIAAATIAPLALGMGHMFPAGLRQLGASSAALVPWAWAVNGVASVIATVGAPLLAMHIGFTRLTLIAAACYVLAAVLGPLLTARAGKSQEEHE